MTLSPQLRALGPTIRLLAVFIDAWADWNWGAFETALLIEGDREEGWNEDHAARTLRGWGVKDQHGVYLLAGLTKAEAEVAFMIYDRQLEPIEVAKYLNRPATTVRVQLHRAQERLRRLAA